jgi:hypothetical protein
MIVLKEIRLNPGLYNVNMVISSFFLQKVTMLIWLSLFFFCEFIFSILKTNLKEKRGIKDAGVCDSRSWGGFVGGL